jgi:hypothetical protein
MFGVLFRLVWRLAVFALGTIAIYAVLFKLFPWLDRHVPLVLVVLLVYGIIAYIIFPLTVRLWRVVFKPNHLPLYAITPDGWPSDPINIAVIAKSRRDFIRTMKRAGWDTADQVNLVTSWKMVQAYLVGTPYPTAPFANLYIFGRKHDLGFQIQTGNPPSPQHRHHVRFWQLKGSIHEHETFWQTLLNRFIRPKRQVWIGAATHDVAPFAFRWRNLQFTHGIDEDTNKEREYLIDTLRKSKQLGAVTSIHSGEQLKFRGQTFGVNIVVDGNIKVIALKKQPAAKRLAEARES